MKTRARILLLLAVAPAACTWNASGQDDLQLDLMLRNQAAHPPKIEAKEIVKRSTNLLHEREPELTDEEYALYEKISVMLRTNPELAVRMLETMMGAKEQPSPAFDFVLGNAYYGAGNNDLSEKYYRGAVERYPGFLRAWKNLGILYYTENRFKDAEPCFEKAVTLGDREADTLGLLAYCHEALGDPLAAQMAYMQALSIDRTNPEWRQGLLRVFMKSKQYAMAEPVIRELIKEKPGDAQLWLDYAGILVAQKRKLEAMAVLESAQAAGAAGPDALELLGDLYAEQGLSREATAVYAKILGTAPARGEQRLVQYARVQIAAGNLDDAGKALASIRGEPTVSGRIALLQTRAELQMARKDWAKAREAIESLLAFAPLNGPALLTLGRISLAQDDLPRASFAFESATHVPATAYEADIELANVEMKNRNYEKAARYLESALKLKRSDAIEDYLARVRILIPPVGGNG